VYRSRLLLDSDLAARSAALGRIYNDLGFQDLGLVEGWNSVNTDPSDFSGHRLLADNYASLPRHEIARVSELFQSQMLQPLNMTPIQPRLGESNLLLVASGGPASLSFNEFNPLFNRDGIHAQGSFLAGEQSTLTGDGIVSGIYKKLSFSAGYSGFSTDGFRGNADQDDKITNVFAQAELSPSTSVQAEYRYRDLEYGDVRLRFFPEDFSPGERNAEKRNTVRVGARHQFSPGSVLLASVMYQDATFTQMNEQPEFPVTAFHEERPETALGMEVQYLFRSRRLNLATGAGYFNIDGQIDSTLELDPEIVPPPFNVLEDTVSTDLNHVNLYAYSYLKPTGQVTAIAGLSADILKGDSPDVGDQDQLNPKFGIIWKPAAGTTVRGAAFRALKRTLITDQTLEPTQVAGFNQFYDENNGTRSWRYGGALDQKFGKKVFGGVEYAQRDLEVPFIVFDEQGNPGALRQDVKERSLRAYFFLAPHRWLGFRAEYVHEKSESEGFTQLPEKVNTDRVPLGMSFFHPSGLSVSVTGTYFNQDGTFVRLDGSHQSGSDDFWTVDAAVNYRLPKRYGFLAVGASNLFNEEFSFYDIDARNPMIQPKRRVYGRITLAF
jgi:hypothetical protein